MKQRGVVTGEQRFYEKMTERFRESRTAASVKMLEREVCEGGGPSGDLAAHTHSAGDLVFPCSDILPTAPAQRL